MLSEIGHPELATEMFHAIIPPTMTGTRFVFEPAETTPSGTTHVIPGAAADCADVMKQVWSTEVWYQLT